MQLSLRSDDGQVLRVDASGRINLAVLAEQQEALSELLEGRGYRQTVLFDMTGVELVDSAGMSWLVVQHKRFCDAGGKFAIHSVPFTVMETLKVMRLDQVLNVADSESEALKLVQGAPE
ncbi:MAG: STAS domain-containing protein [Planctomycetaceae bacterium]|nr:STAS domain-containing protein [Planctomycetaceae bacterium]